MEAVLCVLYLFWIGAGHGWLRRTDTNKSFTSSSRNHSNMDGVAGQIVYPILGIVAAAAATFYAVSFMEIREVRLFATLPAVPPPKSHQQTFSLLRINTRQWYRNHWRSLTRSTQSTRRPADDSAGRGGGLAARLRSGTIDRSEYQQSQHGLYIFLHFTF
jgi:hypothetical protein